ncbi:unnamed protein product [Closterium sp. Yama58-4]|nr:unnamed protein product [Closterium sp. Yama58-4]
MWCGTSMAAEQGEASEGTARAEGKGKMTIRHSEIDFLHTSLFAVVTQFARSLLSAPILRCARPLRPSLAPVPCARARVPCAVPCAHHLAPTTLRAMPPSRRRTRLPFADRHSALRRCTFAAALSFVALSLSALLLLHSPAPLLPPRLSSSTHSDLLHTSPLAAGISARGAVSWARRAWRGQSEGEGEGAQASQGWQAGARRRQLWPRGRPFQGEGGRLWPGRVWLDEEGRRIQAHGGGVLYVASERRYYWYGENKDGDTYALKGSLERWHLQFARSPPWRHALPSSPAAQCHSAPLSLPPSPALPPLPLSPLALPPPRAAVGAEQVDVVGISCYSSADLLHWRAHGVVLAPNTHDPASDLHVSRVMERPKVLFHAAARRYVMWLHVDDAAYHLATTGVAVSSHPHGPFTYVGRFRPNGQESRDMTVFADEDGVAYVVYASEMNAVLHIARLTPDYLDVDGGFVRRFVGRSREAPAVFKYRQHYFLVTSACTGWDPNEAEVHVASHMLGEWRLLGAPCSNHHHQHQHQHQQQRWPWQGESAPGAWAPSCSSTFESQGTFVLPLPNAPPGVFVFLADRWNKQDLADSRYVWLPLHLLGNGSTPTVWGRLKDEEMASQQVAVEGGAVTHAVITWHESWELPQSWLHEAETTKG